MRRQDAPEQMEVLATLDPGGDWLEPQSCDPRLLSTLALMATGLPHLVSGLPSASESATPHPACHLHPVDELPSTELENDHLCLLKQLGLH